MRTFNAEKNLTSLTLSGPEETQRFGSRLSRQLKPGDTVALIGPLGSGKTTLVQGIAAGWGYERRANSPTFALVNEYATDRGRILHMDMYRLSPEALETFPLDDYLSPDALALIEWADRVRERIPAGALVIQLQVANGDVRRAEISSKSADWAGRLAKVTKS